MWKQMVWLKHTHTIHATNDILTYMDMDGWNLNMGYGMVDPYLADGFNPSEKIWVKLDHFSRENKNRRNHHYRYGWWFRNLAITTWYQKYTSIYQVLDMVQEFFDQQYGWNILYGWIKFHLQYVVQILGQKGQYLFDHDHYRENANWKFQKRNHKWWGLCAFLVGDYRRIVRWLGLENIWSDQPGKPRNLQKHRIREIYDTVEGSEIR